MTKAFRYTLYRRSIISEAFYVDANSEAEALQIANESFDNLVTANQEWIDWYDTEYQIDEAFDPEPLDPLYKMIKEHE